MRPQAQCATPGQHITVISGWKPGSLAREEERSSPNHAKPNSSRTSNSPPDSFTKQP